MFFSGIFDKNPCADTLIPQKYLLSIRARCRLRFV